MSVKEKPLGLIAILSIAIAGFAVLGSYTYWNKLTALHAHELEVARDQNERRARQLTEAAAQQFDGTVRSVDTALLYLRDVYAKDRAGFDRAVRLVLANYPPDMLGEVVVMGPDGNVAYSSQASVQDQYLGGQEHFLAHAHSQQDQLFIGRAEADGGTQNHLVPLSRPVFEGQRLLGVICIPMRPQYFADRFSALQVSSQDLLALVRSDGSFIARNQNLPGALDARLPQSRPFLAASAGASGIFRDVSTVDGVPLLFSWRRLTLWPVSVVVAIDERSALELVNTRHDREMERALLSIVVMLAAAVGVALLLLRLARRNAQLGESERRFRRFFEKNGSVMLLVEPESGRIVDANVAAARLYGYPLDKLRSMRITDINTLSPEQVAAEMQRAAREERNYFNFSHRLASGELCDVEVYSTPIAVQGRVHLFSIVNDISKRRSMEAERNLLAMAVEQSPASIVVAKPDGAIAYVNDAFCNTTGYSRAEVLGANPRMLKSGYTTAVQYQEMWDTLLRGKAWKGTFQNVRKDGTSYWESAQISPVLDVDGQLTYYLGIKENITERKLAEERLQELQSRLQASHNLLERLSHHVPGTIYQYQLHPDGRTAFPYASESIRAIYEVTPDEVAQDATPVHQRVHPDDVAAVTEQIQLSASTLTAWQQEYRVLLPRQGLRWLAGLANPLALEDGSVLWHGFIQDITERKQLEQVVTDRNRDMATILDNSSVGICFVRGRLLDWANSRMAEMFGYAVAEIQGCSSRLFYPSEEAYEQVGLEAYPLMAAAGRYVSEREMRTRQGQGIWIRLSGKAVDPQDMDAGSIWVFEDISEQKRLETRLQLAANVFTHAREGIMITDAKGTIVDVNGTFSQITGYSYQDVVGQSPRILQSGRQSAEFYQGMWNSMLDKGHWQGEVWNRRKSGEVYAEMLTISAVRNGSGETQHYVALFSDITPLKRHQQELEHIAHFDALTQLPNRVLLADRLQQGIVQCQRRKQSLAVVFLDLDGFKSINDAFGHAAGDTLLIEVSQRIKAALREGDTLSRIGGDEFVAILADLENVRSCEPVLWRMLQAASSPVLHGNHVLQVTASMGVTLYPQDGVDADLLMRHADQAMYAAKEAGKNRYHVFDIVQDVAIQNRRESVERIRRAVVAGEFVLHYQPKVNLRTSKVVGVEALIRWQHPEHGLLMPHEFLPEMEDHPGSVDIGEWVLDTALRQIGTWQTQGQNLPVSVNIGAYQLQCTDFVERLRQLLQKHAQVPPEQLQIEVLETSALQDLARVGETMLACKAVGVHFALDDFGTSYSSLTYLKHLPAHTLKIDQSFVRDMLTDESDLAIVNGIIGLAAAFGREVIAEGVETRAHGDLLLSLGCELAQGYGIARPMPVEALGAWVQAWDSGAVWTA